MKQSQLDFIRCQKKNLTQKIETNNYDINTKDNKIQLQRGRKNLTEMFKQAKIQQIKNEKDLNNFISFYKQKNQKQNEFNKRKNSHWNKVRGVLKFMAIMKRVIIEKKLFGLSAQIKFLNEEVKQKKEKAMLEWISGKIEISKKEKKQKPYLLYPNSKILNIWTYFIIFLFVYTVFFLPYKISFIDIESNNQKILEWIAFTLFFLDIIISIITVQYQNGQQIDDIKILFTNYCKTWLILDVLSIVPFELIFKSSNSLSDFAKLPRIIKLFKIFRLIKFSKKLKKNQNTKKLSTLLSGNKQVKDFLMFFSLIIFLTHITGCLWYYLTKLQNGQGWIFNLDFELKTDFDKYLASFYWAISTICTVGFGDITAVTSLEKIFNIVWICVGVAFYSYTIGTLSSILNQSNRKKSIISNQFSFINEFSKEKKINKKLLEKITINLEHIEEHNKYSANLSINFLQDISLDLTYQIARHIHSKLIQKVVLFNNLDINFVAQIIPYIKMQKIKAGELIYKKNEYPSHIYFLLKGRIGFFNDSNKMFKCYVEGSYFGEIEIFKSYLRQYKTKALEECHMLMLPREQFLQEIRHFPEIQEEIQLRAIQRDIINKKDLYLLQQMSFINMNSSIDKELKTKLQNNQIRCRNVIKKLKKEINKIVEKKTQEQIQIQKNLQNNPRSSQQFSLQQQTDEQLNKKPKNDYQFKIQEFHRKIDYLNWEILQTNQALEQILDELDQKSFFVVQKNNQKNKLIQCKLIPDENFNGNIQNKIKSINFSLKSINNQNSSIIDFDQQNLFRTETIMNSINDINIKDIKDDQQQNISIKKKFSIAEQQPLIFKKFKDQNDQSDSDNIQ